MPASSEDDSDGADPFYVAINTYLQAYLYGTGTTDNLWGLVSESAGRPLATALQRWTHQQGVPVLNVSRESDELVVTQAQLTQTGSVPVECGVPLTFEMSLPEAGGPSTLGSGTPGESPVSLVVAEDVGSAEAPAGAVQSTEAGGVTDTAAPVEPANAPGVAADSNATRLAWWVPLRYMSGGDGAEMPGEVQWLEVTDCEARAPWPQGASWVKANAGQYGLFRCEQPGCTCRAVCISC